MTWTSPLQKNMMEVGAEEMSSQIGRNRHLDQNNITSMCTLKQLILLSIKTQQYLQYHQSKTGTQIAQHMIIQVIYQILLFHRYLTDTNYPHWLKSHYALILYHLTLFNQHKKYDNSHQIFPECFR